MNVVMLTNTYTPYVGGVARSVELLSRELRRSGQNVLVIAPSYEGMHDEPDVIRLPAWRHVTSGNFSLPMPLPPRVTQVLNAFAPDVLHSHHPFLLGATALRVGAARHLPVVFTHHTLYERYTHYLPGDSERMQQFVSTLATGYANLCDAIIAPSASVAALLRERGVKRPIEIIPTGVDRSVFQPGDSAIFRARLGIPRDGFVVGHVGRLAWEKNLVFLANGVAQFLEGRPEAHFLLAGSGPCWPEMDRIFRQKGLSGRLHYLGSLHGSELVDAYRAMDVFVFASQSETQGMVLTEAMATATPVVAVDGPGVREVVRDGDNGRLLAQLDEGRFVDALRWMAEIDVDRKSRLRANALRQADAFSLECSRVKLESLYERLVDGAAHAREGGGRRWLAPLRIVREEMNILQNLLHSVETSVQLKARHKQ